MNAELRTRMALHGAILLLLGLMAGFPYALVIAGTLVGEERAWKMAHAEGVQNGLLLLAVAGIGERLLLSDRRARLCAWSLIAAGYGNVIASILGAATGNRGLTAAPPLANFVVYGLFVAAVAAVFCGLGLVVIGARAALAARE